MGLKKTKTSLENDVEKRKAAKFYEYVSKISLAMNSKHSMKVAAAREGSERFWVWHEL